MMLSPFLVLARHSRGILLMCPFSPSHRLGSPHSPVCCVLSAAENQAFLKLTAADTIDRQAAVAEIVALLKKDGANKVLLVRMDADPSEYKRGEKGEISGTLT